MTTSIRVLSCPTLMAPRRQVVNPLEPTPSLPSPAPASQPVDSQESFALDDVSGGDQPGSDHGDVGGNNPDAIAMPKGNVAPDILHFFDKSGDKAKCKECM